nr:MAG TPA: DNA gyrase inhibitor [Caudoviricetes sp.]
MTEVQKQEILRLRSHGITFSAIAEKLDLNRNTIKTFVSRSEKKFSMQGKCLNCGCEMEQKPKTKTKQFCSDRCRYQYWNRHRSEKQMGNTLSCAYCGRIFSAPLSASRKYCGRSCYVNARWGEVNHE